MKLRFKFLLLLLPVLLLPSFVRAEERTLTGEWKKIEAGTSIISLEKKGEFIAQLEAKIKALTDASTGDGTVYDYSYSVKRVYQEESKSYTTVNVDKQFSTLKEAEEYYNKLEVEDKTNPKYTEVFSDEFKLVCEGDCVEEIPSDYVCKINPTEYDNIKETFISKEAMDAYQPKGINGFTYVGMKDNSETSCKSIYLKDLYETIYDNKQKAIDVLNEFILTYGGTYSEPKQIENTPVKYYDETDLYYDEDIVDDDVADIQEDLDNNIYNDVSFDGYGTVEKVETSYTENSEINVLDLFTGENEFNTKQAALDAIDDIINNLPEKYTFVDNLTEVTEHILSSTITGVSKIESPHIGTFTQIISDDNDFIIVKQGSAKPKDENKKGDKPEKKEEYILVWTPEEFTSDEKILFEGNLNSGNIDSSISPGVNIIYIFGYKTFTPTDIGLSEDQRWGNYTFSHNDSTGQITFSCDGDKISHMLYGKIENNSYWTIGGKIKVSEELPAWYIMVTITTYSYEIEATGKDCEITYKATYYYERKTMECSDPKYGLSYEIENITYKNYVEIEWFVGSQFLGSGDPTPPNTGLFVETESYTKYFMISFVGIFALYKSRKYVFNK